MAQRFVPAQSEVRRSTEVYVTFPDIEETIQNSSCIGIWQILGVDAKRVCVNSAFYNIIGTYIEGE